MKSRSLTTCTLLAKDALAEPDRLTRAGASPSPKVSEATYDGGRPSAGTLREADRHPGHIERYGRRLDTGRWRHGRGRGGNRYRPGTRDSPSPPYQPERPSTAAASSALQGSSTAGQPGRLHAPHCVSPTEQ